MADAIIAVGGRLKCDADGCGYVEPDASRKITADLIGTACPRCGASLLTAEDYVSAMGLAAVIDALNEVIGPVPPDAERVRMSVNPHAGQINILDGTEGQS